MSVLRRLVSLRYGRRDGDTMRGSRRGYDLALLRAEDKFREVLRACGDRPPPVLGRIVCEENFVDWALEFRAWFWSADGQTQQDIRWALERHQLEEFSFEGASPRDFFNYYLNDCRSLYSRLYEDHLMELELRPRREIVQELLRLNADPAIVQQAQRNYEDFAAHLRRHHHTDRSYAQQLTSQMREVRPRESFSWGVPAQRDYGRAPQDYSREYLMEPIPLPEPSAAMDRMAADMRRQMDSMSAAALLGNPTANTNTATVAERATTAAQIMAQMRQAQVIMDRHNADVMQHAMRIYGIDTAYVSGEVGTPAAQAKGLDLLKSWLTPDQKASYEKHKHFEVKGSDTGKRYRIRHGRQMNIDELDSDGKKVCGYCFLPEGNLVAGDVMLGQKIALETFEKDALKKANKFGDNRAPGAINGMRADFMIIDDTMAV